MSDARASERGDKLDGTTYTVTRDELMQVGRDTEARWREERGGGIGRGGATLPEGLPPETVAEMNSVLGETEVVAFGATSVDGVGCLRRQMGDEDTYGLGDAFDGAVAERLGPPVSRGLLRVAG